jgi:hypothetical protein
VSGFLLRFILDTERGDVSVVRRADGSCTIRTANINGAGIIVRLTREELEQLAEGIRRILESPIPGEEHA